MINDDALQHSVVSRVLSPADLARLKAVRHTVRRFVFDEDASIKAGRFATECTDIVCENAEFALAPFPNTYLEIDFAAAIAASSRGIIFDDVAPRMGFLFLETGEVYVCSGEDGNASFVPFVYRRKDERDPETEERQIFLKEFLIGEVSEELMPRVDQFSHRMTDIWSVDYLAPDLSDELRAMILNEARGEFKRALAALLLLNQKRDVRLVDVPGGRTIRKGKLRPYMAHTVVSIDLSGGSVRGLFRVEDRASPRRHEVRAHYVHYGILEGCSHEWTAHSTPETEKKDTAKLGRIVSRWRCVNCQGIRVRRQKFDRGDAGKGWVVKEYRVKDSRTD
jgi:hypothetical protein